MSDDSLAEQHVREFTRVCVRAGLLPADELHAEVVQAITAELPDRAGRADELADGWLVEAREALRLDQEGWPEATDYERLQSAFDELEIADVVAKVSRGLGEAMVGINVDDIPQPHRLAERGW